MRGLARQRLPARHVRQVDEPLAALLELIRHVVERVDGAPHFVARRAARPPPVSSRRDQSPPAKSVSAAVSCWIGRLTRCAMSTSGTSETSPRRAEQHEQRQREAAPQIARFDRRRRAGASVEAAVDSCSMLTPPRSRL